jgi:hypothetical protein
MDGWMDEWVTKDNKISSFFLVFQSGTETDDIEKYSNRNLN